MATNDYTFHHEEKIIRWRNKKGRFTKKRKGAKKYIERVLYIQTAKGEIKRHGSIRERMKKRIVKSFSPESIPQGIYIKAVLEDNDVPGQLKRNKARGVEVTVSGRAMGKDRRIKTRIIIDKKSLKDAKYLYSLIAGRVQARLKNFQLRVSHHSVSSAKKARQLKKVTFTISFFY